MNHTDAARAARKPMILVYIFSAVLEDFVPMHYCHSMSDAEAEGTKLTAAGIKNWVISQSKEEFLRTIKDLPAEAEKKFA